MHGQRHWYAVLLLCASTCRADGFGGELGIASEEVLRGLSQSDHQLSPQLDVHYSKTGIYGGLSAVEVRRGSSASAGAGLIAYLGYQKRFGDDWSATLSARHYDYPGFGRRDLYDYDELAVSAAWRERIVAAVAVSPNVYSADFYGNDGRGAGYTYEVSARQPLPLGLSASAGVGYDDLRRQIGTGYLYWSAGVALQWRSWDFDLRYVGTDSTAKQRFERFAENRLVVSALWFF
jgi:uncharacterized protein (TIGR02001 family)